MSQAVHLSVIILAAGQGSRMKSSMPKVLHPLAGTPLLGHVLNTARKLNPRDLAVVYGHGGDQVLASIKGDDIRWALQDKQLGTGHAVDQAMPGVSDDHIALILYGDVPLTKLETLAQLVNIASQDKFALLTVHLDNPTGYGRIVRDSHGSVQRIVEEKDADAATKAITEVNTGILAVSAKRLRGWLKRLDNKNAQGEYYLTDTIAMAVNDGIAVQAVHPGNETEVMGINSRSQLAAMERVHQRNIAETLMAQGVTLADPARLDVRGEVDCGRDVTIDVNVILEGKVVIGEGSRIGANCVIRDSVIEPHTEILPMCVIEEARVGGGCRVGPFSRLRPGASLAGDNHIGNFVEIKNSQIGTGSKVNHLSYVGDTSMGCQVNIGAGTITANYDGANKHRTVIEDNASTGSNSVLVAPVTVGKGATLGAATVLRKDAPEGKLTVAVIPQKIIEHWKRPTKKPKE